MTHTDILETLDEAIEFVGGVEFADGYSDGSPDASPDQRRANYLVGQLRKARAEIAAKDPHAVVAEFYG